MKIDDKNREKVLAVLKKAAQHHCLTKEEKELINLFENPVALNMGFKITDYTFTNDPNMPRFEYKHIKHLIRKGKLFFDFTGNKVGICDKDCDSQFGKSEDEAFFVIEDDEGLVDYCRFDIREIIYVDETHFDVIDRGCHNGDKRRFTIR